MYTVIHLLPHKFITNQQKDQHIVSLLAQLVEHSTSITVVMGSTPRQAWIFFEALHSLLFN